MFYLKQSVIRTLAVLLVLVSGSVRADAVPPGTEDEIRERLAPFGSLCRAGEDCGTTQASTASSGALSGEQVYNQFCFACHATGASEAPMFGDAAAWAPRIEKGMEVLMNSTLNGTGLMPPRGTCMNCSDEELHAAVEYMLDQVR